MSNAEKMLKIRDLFNQVVNLCDTVDLNKFQREGGVGHKDRTLVNALKEVKIYDDTKWHDRFKKYN